MTSILSPLSVRDWITLAVLYAQRCRVLQVHDFIWKTYTTRKNKVCTKISNHVCGGQSVVLRKMLPRELNEK